MADGEVLNHQLKLELFTDEVWSESDVSSWGLVAILPLRVRNSSKKKTKKRRK